MFTACRLHVLSRLKGIETLLSNNRRKFFRIRLHVLSRLKGIETLQDRPDTFAFPFTCAFPFEGN